MTKKERQSIALAFRIQGLLIWGTFLYFNGFYMFGLLELLINEVIVTVLQV
jgi:hypothetical protein